MNSYNNNRFRAVQKCTTRGHWSDYLKKNLQNVTRTLHELIKTLPAIRANCSADVLDRHLQLIAYFQRQYDQLIQASKALPNSA